MDDPVIQTEFKIEDMLNKIPKLIDKGRQAELKKSEHFINTLKDTQVINLYFLKLY